MTSIDALDAQIILALDDDPDATILSLARTLGIARNTVHARLRRLAEDGTLKPFSQRLDLRALGYELGAFMSLSISQTDPGIVAGLLEVPEVISAHHTTGDADILVQVVAKSTHDLHRITDAILTVDGVVRTSTVISSTRLSHTGRTPCSASRPDPGADPDETQGRISNRRPKAPAPG